MVEERLPGRQALLDMGTGGGEFLSSLAGLPATVWATESHAPNIPIARQRLESYGYRLQPMEPSAPLPFDDRSFDIVINRHSEFDSAEVERCLRPGGVFVTQQVGGLNATDLNQALGAPLPDHVNWCLVTALSQLASTALLVSDTAQHTGTYRFFSVDAVVFYLRAIPWQIPGLTVDGYLDRLALLDDLILRDGHIDIMSQRFMLVASKPAEA